MVKRQQLRDTKLGMDDSELAISEKQELGLEGSRGQRRKEKLLGKELGSLSPHD